MEIVSKCLCLAIFGIIPYFPLFSASLFFSLLFAFFCCFPSFYFQVFFCFFLLFLGVCSLLLPLFLSLIPSFPSSSMPSFLRQMRQFLNDFNLFFTYFIDLEIPRTHAADLRAQ